MKIITKTSLNFITLSVVIFMAGSVLFYLYLRSSSNQEINNDLIDYKNRFFREFTDSVNLTNIFTCDEIQIEAVKTAGKFPNKYQFNDTILRDKFTGRFYLYRQLKVIKTRKGQNLQYTFSKPLKNNDQLITNISFLIAIIFSIFSAGLFILNRLVMKKSWATFYDTIHKLRDFNTTQGKKIELQKSDIEEFNQLNKTITRLTEKIINDFENLKEYTENTSHEIQTPLAIINTKIEILLQTENLSDKQLKLIVSIYEAASRLSKLNKSLIYLTKIDRRLFPATQKINLSELILKNLQFFQDFISEKEIKIVSEIENNISFSANADLLDTLFINLIKNAIKHNIQSGKIWIKLNNNFFEIKNTSDYTSKNPTEFFERFKKRDSSSQSPGVGLTIVKKICATYNLITEYTSNNNIHKIKIFLHN